jgi:hypothetical protein
VEGHQDVDASRVSRKYWLYVGTIFSSGNEIERVGKGGDVASALLQRLYHPDEALLHRQWPDLLEDYPAHLHIDILPNFQAMGGGRRLMAELMKKLNADRVRGIHLMKAGRTRGRKFSMVVWDLSATLLSWMGVRAGRSDVRPGEAFAWFRNLARGCVGASSTASGLSSRSGTGSSRVSARALALIPARALALSLARVLA